MKLEELNLTANTKIVVTAVKRIEKSREQEVLGQGETALETLNDPSINSSDQFTKEVIESIFDHIKTTKEIPGVNTGFFGKFPRDIKEGRGMVKTSCLQYNESGEVSMIFVLVRIMRKSIYMAGDKAI